MSHAKQGSKAKKFFKKVRNKKKKKVSQKRPNKWENQESSIIVTGINAEASKKKVAGSITYYNCNKKNYISRDCTRPKKQKSSSSFDDLYIGDC